MTGCGDLISIYDNIILPIKFRYFSFCYTYVNKKPEKEKDKYRCKSISERLLFRKESRRDNIEDKLL